MWRGAVAACAVLAMPSEQQWPRAFRIRIARNAIPTAVVVPAAVAIVSAMAVAAEDVTSPAPLAAAAVAVPTLTPV